MFVKIRVVLALLLILVVTNGMGKKAWAEEKKAKKWKISKRYKKMIHEGVWDVFRYISNEIPGLHDYYFAQENIGIIEKMINIAIDLIEKQEPLKITDDKLYLFFKDWGKGEIYLAKYMNVIEGPLTVLIALEIEALIKSFTSGFWEYFKYYENKTWEQNTIYETQMLNAIEKVENGLKKIYNGEMFKKVFQPAIRVLKMRAQIKSRNSYFLKTEHFTSKQLLIIDKRIDDFLYKARWKYKSFNGDWLLDVPICKACEKGKCEHHYEGAPLLRQYISRTASKIEDLFFSYYMKLYYPKKFGKIWRELNSKMDSLILALKRKEGKKLTLIDPQNLKVKVGKIKFEDYSTDKKKKLKGNKGKKGDNKSNMKKDVVQKKVRGSKIREKQVKGKDMKKEESIEDVENDGILVFVLIVVCVLLIVFVMFILRKKGE